MVLIQEEDKAHAPTQQTRATPTSLSKELNFDKKDFVVLGCIAGILSILGVSSFYPLQQIQYPVHLYKFITKYILPNRKYFTAAFLSFLSLILFS